jgi:DNA (cytosine-5)-methyltransferase 1
MRAVSLFSGCGGDTLGLERAGFKVVAFSEFNKAAIASHLANFPDSEHLVEPTSKASDITKIPNSVFEKFAGADLVFAGFPCFVKGTLVLTNKGYKEIQDVRLDDRLLTHMGRFRDIVNLQAKVYTGSIYDIKLKYHPSLITATQEHPFYVRSKKQIWNSSRRKYDTTFGEPEWKEANKLSLDDYFGMSINQASSVPEFTIPRQVNANRVDSMNLTLDKKDQWFMMGYFVGDGWVEDTRKKTGQFAHKIRFAINTRDLDTVLPRIQSVLPITDKNCSTGKCKKFGCVDLAWWTVLKMFGKYAHGKLIPEWVQDAPKEFIQEFISGYMAADGHVKKDGTNKITTVSHHLAFGLQRLYLKLGYVFSINKTTRPKTCVIEGRTVNQRDTYQLEGRLRECRYSTFIEGNYVWYAPSKISPRDVMEEPVFNFEVEEDNSYCVENTLVHNCQGFSRAGKKKKEDPRNQMFQQFVRATSQIKPRFVIGENVTGLLTMKSGPNEEDPLMIDLIRAAFLQIGYELSHKILEGTAFGVPQKRKRILIVGWDKSRVSLDTASFWASVSAHGAAKAMPTMRSFVTNSMDGAFLLTPQVIPEGFAAYALEVPNGTKVEGKHHPFVELKANAKLLSCSKRDSPIHSEIIDLDAPSKTIICTYDHQPRLLLGLKKPNGHFYARTLHPVELKQIQGFPADYIVSGSVKEQITQIGNAVPPALVEAVATVLKGV